MIHSSGANLSLGKIPRSRGFTLIEVMLAILVILLGLVPLLGLLVKCVHVHSVSDSLTQGTLLAESQLSELLSQSDLTERRYQGRFDLEGSDVEYRWSADVSPLAEPVVASLSSIGLWHVTLTLTWAESDSDKEVRLDTVVRNPNEIQMRTGDLNISSEGTRRGTL
jgi:prepilin-type N-terminal cleavage/methylation domain-containing protein